MYIYSNVRKKTGKKPRPLLRTEESESPMPLKEQRGLSQEKNNNSCN